MEAPIKKKINLKPTAVKDTIDLDTLKMMLNEGIDFKVFLVDNSINISFWYFK